MSSEKYVSQSEVKSCKIVSCKTKLFWSLESGVYLIIWSSIHFLFHWFIHASVSCYLFYSTVTRPLQPTGPQWQQRQKRGSGCSSTARHPSTTFSAAGLWSSHRVLQLVVGPSVQRRLQLHGPSCICPRLSAVNSAAAICSRLVSISPVVSFLASICSFASATMRWPMLDDAKACDITSEARPGPVR